VVDLDGAHRVICLVRRKSRFRSRGGDIDHQEMQGGDRRSFRTTTRRYHRSLLTRRKTGGQMHEERDGAALRPGSRWLSRRQRGQRWTGRDSRVEIAGGLRLG